jgi:hypothetical protein
MARCIQNITISTHNLPLFSAESLTKMSSTLFFSVSTERFFRVPDIIYIDQELYDNPKPIDFPLCDETFIRLFSLDPGYYVRQPGYSDRTKAFVYLPLNRRSVFISLWTSTPSATFYKKTYEEVITNLF